MRRIALLSVGVLAAAVAAVLLLAGASGGGDPYRVRAIFDDASFAVQGEEVRIAGAPVGTIASLGVTSGKRAAVTLEIDNAGFRPFHSDAFCAIRPQSLIGEKYVDCNPGTAAARALPRINHGPGAGTYYLPVTRTSSPVDSDLVQDIYRDPVRQRLSLILNELGTGLATRGSDLNEVIHRANPALGYTDEVLRILGAQNRQLAQLARDSDTVLTPLAHDRQAISRWVVTANATARASAARANDIAASFHLLPPFLRQLRPLMADLAGLADQATPGLSALSRAAPALARQYEELAPFAAVARRSLIALGAAAVRQQPALVRTIPLTRRLLALGRAGLPSFRSLDKLTASFDRTGGIEQLMAVLFYGTAATNGFDAVGHYIRTEALVGGCTSYAKTPVAGCSANFKRASATADVALAAVPRRTATAAASPALSGLLGYLLGSRR